MQQHLADKNIALDLVRVTEAAALASAKFTGLGDKELVDRAAYLQDHSLELEDQAIALVEHAIEEGGC